MKKLLCRRKSHHLKKKIGLKMKLSVLIFISTILTLHANDSYTQETRISLEMVHVSVERVLEAIESSTDFRFVYRIKDVDLRRKVSIEVNEVTIDQILHQLFANTMTGFKIIDRQIFLLKQRKIKNGPLKLLDTRSDIKLLAPIPVDTLYGEVFDEGGEPLIGVNIQVKGTNQGTATDFDGKFAIVDVNDNAVLIFSYIGYQTQEMLVEGRSNLIVTLSEDSQTLDEVIVIGYGTVRKSDLTGSVGTIDAKDFQQNSPTNIQQAIAGKIAGVYVSQNSGRPGGRSTIRIRGNSSVTGVNEPLYVVDGVVLPTVTLSNGTSPIDYLNPGNIRSIEVLKDASATAIYGARGANGVVLITTRTPSRGGTITYNGSLKLGILPKKIDLLNSEEFLRVEDIAYQNAEKYGLKDRVIDPATKRTDQRLFDSQGNPRYDTDWQDELYRTSISNNHNIAISGGDINNSYLVNLGYRNEEGLLEKSYLKRYSGRLTIDNKVNEWITAGGTISYNVQKSSQPRALGAGGVTPTRSALQAPPLIPVRYPDGGFGNTLDYPGMAVGGLQPVQMVNQEKRLVDGINALGSAYADIKLADNLNFRTNFGYIIIDQETKYYADDDLEYISGNGNASLSDEKISSWQFENMLTYSNDFFENHSFTGLVGVSWEGQDNFNKSASAQDFIDDFFQFNNLGVASNPRPPSSNASSHSLNSYFARVNYVINSRYLITLTSRIDGSSRFAEANRYAFFPSGAVGWRISEEEFMQSIPFMSNLKVRSSFGLTGNSEIPNYRTVMGLGNYSYIFNSERVTGVGISRMANTNLKWEKNSQFDIGIEIGLFENRIFFEGDIYYRKSEDMLLNAPVPAQSGYTTVIRNIGSMENRGIELSFTIGSIQTPDLNWSTDFNISMNRNKVLNLTGGQDIIQGGNPVLGNRIIREGEPVNSFYGLVNLGTWNTDQTALAAEYNRLPGDVRYKDVNNDGVINENDRVIIGNGSPDVYGSMINNLRYNNFTLVLDLQFMFGNDVSWGTKGTSQDRVGITNVLSTVLNAWTPDNQDTSVPEIRPTAAYTDRETSSSRIYNGSFIRGKNLSLSYDLPLNLIGKWGFNQFRIHASIQNFFLVSDYPGYDPEVSTNASNFSQGVDIYSYPKSRIFQIGLNFSF